MKDTKNKIPAPAAKIGAKITYDPRLDAFVGKLKASSKLAEANKLLASLDYDSLPDELKSGWGK